MKKLFVHGNLEIRISFTWKKKKLRILPFLCIYIRIPRWKNRLKTFEHGIVHIRELRSGNRRKVQQRMGGKMDMERMNIWEECNRRRAAEKRQRNKMRRCLHENSNSYIPIHSQRSSYTILALLECCIGVWCAFTRWRSLWLAVCPIKWKCPELWQAFHPLPSFIVL